MGDGGSSAATVTAFPGSYPWQLCRFYSTNDLYIRGYYSGTGWTSWEKIALSGEAQPASDVYAWAKKSSKPSYKTSEVAEETNLYFTNKRAVDACAGTYLPLSGGTLSGNLVISKGSTADVSYTSGNASIEFNSGEQPVKLIYSHYDSYRAPAGLKVIGDQGECWFEADGNIYGKSFYKKDGTEVSYSGHTHTKSEVGLGNVDNTADADKSVNYANIAGSAATHSGYSTSIKVDGDSNTYYPVIISTTLSKNLPNIVTIWKNLGSTTASYPGNHSNGTASCFYRYDVRNAMWDGNGGYCKCLNAWYGYAALVAETSLISMGNGNLCIWLRGGGTTYEISSTWSTSATIYYEKTNVYSTTYPAYVEPRTTIGNGGVYTSVPLGYGDISGSATKATQDSDGNAINSTYLKLSGGAMSSGARISASGGNLVLGNSNNAGWVQVQDMCSQSGSDKWKITQAGSANFVGSVTATGGFVSGSNVTVTGKVSASSGFYEESDERLKSFKDPLKVDLEKLSKLRKSYFTFNSDPDDLQIGVSAQEIQSLYPELVAENENGNLTVAYDKLSVIALAAVDQLSEENTKLKQQNEEILKRLEKIEKLLSI